MKISKLLTKTMCVVLSLSMLMSMMVFAEEGWDVKYYDTDDYALTKLMPYDGYTSVQNPPSFHWGKIDEATSYEFVIARDKELKDIIYTKKDLKQNLWFPEKTLETGVALYWSARYYIGDEVSTWSTPQCFKITGDAAKFPVPDIDTLLDRIPESHPRVWVQKENLEEFRRYKDISPSAKYVYDDCIATSDTIIKNNIIEKEVKIPEGATAEEIEALRVEHRSKAWWNIEKAYETAFAYLLTGDAKYADYAKRCMLEYQNYDAREGFTSFKLDQQVARDIVWQGALVYDWLYDYLTEEERTIIRDILAVRMEDLTFFNEMIEKWNMNSMGWTSYGYLPIAAIAMYGDIPASEDYLRKALPGYISLFPNWSYQDGGWSQGTGYCWWSLESLHEAIGAYASSGVINLYETAWQRNNINWNLYQQPYNAGGNFGDGANEHDFREYMVFNNMHDINFTNDDKNGYRKWIAENAGGIKAVYKRRITYCLAPKYDATEAVAPYFEPAAYKFKDSGFVSMLSDTVDPNRVQLAFRSSPYGNSVHNHNDQNGIFIEAYGQKLSQHAGIYETLSYGSQHHTKVVRATWAHNTITVDNQDQIHGRTDAEGAITGFLHQQEFDLAMGDATKAYSDLGLYERSIIYLRPDMFVIVDDLKASEGKESTFQWWLNAKSKIELYENQRGGRITEQGAMLDAEIQYPQNVTTKYSDVFAGPDGVEYPPVTKIEPHTRIWFETEKTPATKMIVTLDVHPGTREKRKVDTKYYDKYVRMIFEDGSKVFVNLGEPNETVSVSEGYTFTGRALAYTDNSIMLVKGTNVKKGKNDLIILEKEGSVVVGRDELSISTQEDNRISINTDNEYVKGIKSVTKYYGEPIGKEIGISYEQGKLVKEEKEIKKFNLQNKIETKKVTTTKIKSSKNFITFTAIKDDYQLMLNGKKIEEKMLKGTVKVIVDDKEEVVETVGYIGRSGEAIYNGKVDFGGEKYIVREISKDLIPGSLMVSDKIVNISDLDFSTSSKEGAYIKLEKIKMNKCEIKTEADYDAVKEKLAWFSESENWLEAPPDVTTYTTRTFLSGGVGVSNFDTPETKMTYKVTVPEDGKYNVVIKYVAWGYQGLLPNRAISFDNINYWTFIPEKTEDFGTVPGVWRACVVDSGIELTNGEHILTMEALNAAMWNMDWIGLIKQ